MGDALGRGPCSPSQTGNVRAQFGADMVDPKQWVEARAFTAATGWQTAKGILAAIAAG